MRRALALSGLAAPALLTATWLVAGQAAGAYSPLREDLSTLAARPTAPGFVLTAAIALAGAGGLAVGAAMALRRAGALRLLAAVLTGLGGAGLAALAALPISCSEDVDPVCRARSAAGLLPWQDAAHNLVVIAALACLLGAQACLALGPARAAPGVPRAVWRALLAATALAVAGHLGHPAPAVNGLLERVVVTLAMAFLALAALAMLRETRPGGAGGPGLTPER